MISMHGVTWTDSVETMQLYEQFGQEFGRDIAKPCCLGCGRETCYIVEPAKTRIPKPGFVASNFSLPGLNLLANLMTVGKFAQEDKVYIPVTGCHRCGARRDAEERFRAGMATPPDSSTWALTEAERREYNMIYRLRVGDLEKRQEQDLAEKDRRRLGRSS